MTDRYASENAKAERWKKKKKRKKGKCRLFDERDDLGQYKSKQDDQVDMVYTEVVVRLSRIRVLK